MKLKTTLALLLLLSFFSIKAQKPIISSEDSIRVGNSLVPGISVLIPEVDYEKTLGNWKKTLESGTKSTVVTENGEMTIFGAIIKDIVEYPVNVYSKLQNRDSALYLGVALELKKDQYIQRVNGDAELARAKTYLFNFAKNQYIDLVEEQLITELKKLKNLEKELGSSEKDGSGMEKTIRVKERAISSENDKIITLKNTLTSLSVALAEHTREYNTLKSGEEKDEKAAYIKDLEKQKKRNMKAISKSENRIMKYEKEIQKAKTSIPRNDTIQNKFQGQINDQENIVQKYTDKLNQVKGYRLN